MLGTLGLGTEFGQCVGQFSWVSGGVMDAMVHSDGVIRFTS